MNKRIAAAAAVLALSTTLVFAGPRGGHGGHGRHGKGELGAKFAQELNLTENQQRLIADIRKNTRLQSKELFEQSRDTMRAAREARKANDSAKLDSLKPALETQRAQMKQLRDAEERQILSVLNADQKVAYEKLKAERKAKHENRREHKQRD